MPRTYYCGYVVPQAFRPTTAYADEFIKDRDAVLTGRVPTACTIDCAGEGLPCGECLFGTIHFYDWHDIARFEACEQYLFEVGVLTESNYTRKPLEFEGVTIPWNIRSVDYCQVVRKATDYGIHKWCPDVGHSCTSTSCCGSCIYADGNLGSSTDHRVAFAKYARACGYVVDLPADSQVATPPVAATMLEQRPEAHKTTAEINDLPASLVRFNLGFACWCNRQYGDCPVDSCANCMCSTANPQAVEQFTQWAKDHGMETTRASLKDDYAPQVLPNVRVVDRSMRTESFEDPYVLPKLRAGDFVRLSKALEADAEYRRTRWFQLISDAVDHASIGCSSFEMLSVLGLDVNGQLFEPCPGSARTPIGLVLGFIYTLDTTARGAVSVADVVEVCRFVDWGIPCGNGPGRINVLQGSSSFGLHWKVAKQ